MIWIQSDDHDLSTNMVIDWLDHYRRSWIRTNTKAVAIRELRYDGGWTTQLEQQKTDGTSELIDINDVDAYWYRRGELYIHRIGQKKEKDTADIVRYLEAECGTIQTFIYKQLEQVTHINKSADNNINKMLQLYEARRAGLRIPQTFIVRSKKELSSVFERFPEIICKSLTISGIRLKDGNHSWGTQLIDKNNILTLLESIPEQFYPTLLQEHITKKYEVRTFFLKDRYWSSCILSQNDVQTKIDFRNYNQTRPNHTPPCRLPEYIEKKLYILTTAMDLTSGSIDLIYGEDKEYYFLEINPIGQFWQVSNPCNYYLEKEIALFLMNE